MTCGLASRSRATNLQTVRLLEAVSRCEYASNVKELEVGLNNWVALKAVPQAEDYIRTLATMFLSCLQRFPNLRILRFSGDHSFLNNPVGNLEETRALNLYARAYAAALRCIPLPHIDELVLDFPLAHNFWPIISKTGPTVSIHSHAGSTMDRLRHLRIRLGPDCGDRDDEVLYAMNALPNFAPAPPSNMLRLVKLASGLRHLEIANMDDDQIMVLDGLRLASSARLSSLYLRGVRLSSETIISLVEQCREHLGRVQFGLVELTSGTWEGILNHISRLPRLHYFYVDTCGYSALGLSSHLRPHLSSFRGPLPPPESRVAFESKHDNDWPAYAHIQRRVNANRKAMGLELVDGTRYRHLGDHLDYGGTE